MILMIDNYDSFTFNLVQYIEELGAEVEVHRNDAITLDDIRAKRPAAIVVSPGPCTPREAGISKAVIERFAGEVPILGVCLGHQAIAEVFGAKVDRGPEPVHGKTAEVFHDGRTIYEGLSNPFTATRYHSLVAVRDTVPDVLEISAWTEDGLVMGLRHVTMPIEGVQFHPESILTTEGKALLANFLGAYVGQALKEA
jgi:anthranilate synthase/aminodeoxychorismate synthase-like glutamine amidotransferase